MSKFNKDSSGYIFTFAIIMTVVLGSVLAFTSESLKEKQAAEREFERKKLPQHLRKQIMKRKTQLMENAKKHGVNVAAAQEAAARAAVEEAVSGSSMALNQEQHAKKLNQEIVLEKQPY